MLFVRSAKNVVVDISRWTAVDFEEEEAALVVAVLEEEQVDSEEDEEAVVVVVVVAAEVTVEEVVVVAEKITRSLPLLEPWGAWTWALSASS